MNPDNAMWLLDVMTTEVRRLMANAEAQAQRLAELERRVKQLETPSMEAKPEVLK